MKENGSLQMYGAVISGDSKVTSPCFDEYKARFIINGTDRTRLISRLRSHAMSTPGLEEPSGKTIMKYSYKLCIFVKDYKQDLLLSYFHHAMYYIHYLTL